jgi:hypothetical protein
MAPTPPSGRVSVAKLALILGRLVEVRERGAGLEALAVEKRTNVNFNLQVNKK